MRICKMSDYYEYYHNNPHEIDDMPEDEYEEMIHDAMLDELDEIEGSDCVDLGLEQNEESFYNAIRGITLAYYDMDDKQILTNAKILGKLVTDKLTKLVEKDL